MNSKQLIFMWCGIAAIVLAGLTVIENYGLVCLYGFSVWVFIVALITGGLIYSFKDKKSAEKLHDIRSDILKKRRLEIRKDDQQQAQVAAAKDKGNGSDRSFL